MGEIGEFIDYLKYEKRYSHHTILAYQNDLQEFEKFLEVEYFPTSPSAADNAIIRLWLVNLSEKGNSNTSINRKISCLRSYYSFLKKFKGLQINPMSSIRLLKKPKLLPKFLRTDTVEKLIQMEISENDYESVLDSTLFNLFYATGIRLSELTSIQDSDIDFYNHSIKVMGKRNKVRIIPLHDEIVKILQQYNKVRNDYFKEKVFSKFFITPNGKDVYQKFVYRRIHDYLGKVSTLSKKSPHILRHTFATHMLNNGADLNAIKEILGHASLAATQVYTHNSIEQLKSIYKQAHPKA